jgi:hypothetical protein
VFRDPTEQPRERFRCTYSRCVRKNCQENRKKTRLLVFSRERERQDERGSCNVAEFDLLSVGGGIRSNSGRIFRVHTFTVWCTIAILFFGARTIPSAPARTFDRSVPARIRALDSSLEPIPPRSVHVIIRFRRDFLHRDSGHPRPGVLRTRFPRGAVVQMLLLSWNCCFSRVIGFVFTPSAHVSVYP